MTRIVQQIGRSPFPEIKHFTSLICRVEAPKERSMPDAFENWRRALRGEKQPIYESEPWCGYFAVQDRSPGVKPAKGNRWPLIACAIMVRPDGSMTAERAGVAVPVEWVWPYAAMRPITYERYLFWHEHKHWPEEAEAA